MSTHRWKLSFDNGDSWVLATPLNDGKLKIQLKRDLDAGQIFFRKYINQGILFGKADFPQFRAIERQASRRCNTILVKLELKCNNVHQEYWRGKFSTGSGKFNLFECTFEVQPDTVDKYSCILEQINTEINVLEIPYVTATAAVSQPIEFGIFISRTEFDGPPPPCVATLRFPADVTTDPSWTEAHSHTDGDDTIHIYWRETVVNTCIGEAPDPPQGTGWSLLSNDCETTGTAKWWRVPTVAYDLGDSYISPVPCDPASRVKIFSGGSATDNCGHLQTFAPRYLCIPDEVGHAIGLVVQYRRARPLQDVVAYMLEKTGCLSLAVSDFFEWNPIGTAPGYSSGQNYVTGNANQIASLVLVQASDAILPNATTPASVGKLTFKDLFALWKGAFRVYWDIDEKNNLRIEHYRYWNFGQGLNLSQSINYYKVVEPMGYAHLKGETPTIERLNWRASQGKDFIGVDLLYTGPCVTTDGQNNVKEYSAGAFTTDIRMIQSDPGAISRDGFIILATTTADDVYETIIDNGALSGSNVVNAPLSTANLQRDFWTWDRFLPNGNMNGQDVTFDGFVPNIEQERVSATVCCDVLRFDPKKRVTTTLGARLGGITAMVDSAEFDLLTCRLHLTLNYTY
jgi:hypothetical protein